MKIRSQILALITLSAFFSTVYALHQPVNNVTTVHHQSQSQKADAEAIAFIITVDNNEMAAAHLATQKKIDPKVKSYAKLMKKEHGKNLRTTLELSKKLQIAPLYTSKIQGLKMKGERELISLSALNSRNFETAYIDEMVKGHTDVLFIIDNNYLKNAHNPKVMMLLENTRKHVVKHLAKAKAIQQALKN